MLMRVTVAAALHVAATVALRTGHRPLATRMWRRALALIGPTPSSPGTRFVAAHCLAGTCGAKIQAGRYPHAADVAGRGLSLIGEPRRRRDLIAASILHNHAGVAARLAGRHHQARQHYESALSGYRNAGLGRSTSAAVVYHNLGGLAFAEGRLQDAERLTAHAARLNRWSPVRRAGDRGMLAAIIAAQGRLDEAESLLRDALAVFRRRYGAQHREIAFGLGNLAEILRRQGATEEAQRVAEHACAIGERALGPAHPELAPILNTLALLCSQAGDNAGARDLLERASNILQDGVAATHPARETSFESLTTLEGRAAPPTRP